MALAASSLHAQQIPETPDDPDAATAAAAEAVRPKLPMELPPTAPNVSCKDGQLTIVAENSTMASVLAAVHGCIGAAIVAPEGSAGTRMYARLGPGPANEILQSLLSDTDFDYVIEPSPSNPQAIQTVLLMARVKDTKDQQLATDRNMTPARRAWLDARRNARPYDEINGETRATAEPEAEPVVEPVVAVATPVPDATAPPVAATTTDKPADAVSADPAQQAAKAAATPTPDALPAPAPTSSDVSSSAPDPATTSPAAKEVQDKITTMQQMFEQRKQMVQGQPATPANPQ